MIRTSGNLVIPIVTWAPTPPVHKISSILASDDGRDVVTGASDGTMILWSINEAFEFTARWLITGHRAPVRHLCLAGSRSDENTRVFFSHSDVSEMALWNWQDGKCSEFKIDTRHQHTTIKSHQPAFLEYRLLFCCGRYPHIVVFHAMSLSVLFTLASQAHSDWLSSFAVFTHPNQKHEIVLGISFSNMVTLWTLSGEEIQGEANYEHESRVITCSSTVLQVHCCPQTPRCVLLVTSSDWQLLDAMTCSVFCITPTPSTDPLVGGQFIDSNLVAIYCRSGTGLLYRVAPRLVAAQQSGSSSSLYTDVPVLLAKLSPSRQVNGLMGDGLRSTIAANERGLCCFYLPESPSSSLLLFGGTVWGAVLSWRLDPFASTVSSGQTIKTYQDPVLPTTCGDLESIWRRHPPPQPLDLWEDEDYKLNVIHKDKSQQKHRDTITVCVQLLQMTCSRPQHQTVVHADRLAFGLSSGRIVVVRLTDFLQVAYRSSSSADFKSNATGLLKFGRFCLEGHQGPVTSLLHPASADTQYGRCLCDAAEEKSPAEVTSQFNPDHLLSGGADFTVRLWDLDPWRDVHHDRLRVPSNIPGGDCSTPDHSAFAPACLAVFRCHASPCLALSVGPPSSAVSHAAAGNPRLNSCICSIGTDGSVSVISLREQRILLSTSPCNSVSKFPVTAIGWRVPEDVLLVAHADGLLEVWDITVGCLDRVETDSGARDVFEQAHYVIEVHSASTSFNTSLSQICCQSSSLGAHHTRAPTIVFSGCVNSSHSSGSVLHTAPARLRRTPHLRRLSSAQQHVPTVLLHGIGVTNANEDTTFKSSLSSGPAAFVFHWDTEAMILNLLAENTCIADSTDKQNSLDSDTAAKLSGVHCTSLVKLLQLFISSLHPWGLDSEADQAALACVGIGDSKQSGAVRHLPDYLCVGFLSKHGCLSLCLPGWSSGDSSRVQTISRVYTLSHGVSTNIMLAELSLCETLTSLDTNCAEQLLQLSQASRDNRISLVIGDMNEDEGKAELACVRASWLQLASRLCGPLLAQCIWGSPQLTVADACRLPELEILVQKWQDRMIPIRYAARSLLFAYLDHMGHANRQLLVDQWSALLPSFAAAQLSKSSAAHPTSGGVQSLNGSPAIQRSHLIQSPSTTDTQLNRRMSTGIVNGSVPNSKSASPQHTLPQHSINQGLPTSFPSVSLCSLESAGLISHTVADSHWWLTLSGYRVSPREHARLQAIAIVLLGVIGTRFGTSVCRRHPAVCARDLIDDSKPIYQPTTRTDLSGSCNIHSRNPGLASPCFTSPDIADNRVSQNQLSGLDTKPLSIEYFSPTTSSDDLSVVPTGFSFDNHELARSTCQCLTALLFNRTTLHDTTAPDHKSFDSSTGRIPHTLIDGQSGSSITSTNALVSLLTSNSHSSLRRAAIDLLSRGFVVWEPYVDLGQILNALLHIAADAEQLMSNLAPWQPIPDQVDLARTAREALWAIGFARPKSIILVLSLEVRRYGAQINAAASATPQAQTVTSVAASNSQPNTSSLSSDTIAVGRVPTDTHAIPSTGRRESPGLSTPGTVPTTPRMMVMMTSPAVAAPVFAPALPTSGITTKPGVSATGSCPPMFAARDELIRLFEHLCVRRATDVVSVLPELVEVILACLDRTRLKERGLDFVFPALRQFSAFSSHTRMQKACVGGVNGSLTFFDFKIGRFFVTTGHKGPVTAVRFHSDGRLVATYSLTESTLRIWQLHTTGLFGMGGQQVRAISTHPVPPLLPPPKHVSTGADKTALATSTETPIRTECISSDPVAVWLDWPEARVVHLITDSGVKRRINV